MLEKKSRKKENKTKETRRVNKVGKRKEVQMAKRRG